MKQFLLICSLFLAGSLNLFAQDELDKDSDETIRKKMTEYIIKRLDLKDDESKKFTPVFSDYYKEWRKTLQQFRGPEKKLERQQKVVELRLKYRPKFQGIVGEKRGARVYDLQDRFVQEMRMVQKNRNKKGARS